MGFSNSLIVQSSVASESGDSARLSPEQRQAQPILRRAKFDPALLQIVILVLGHLKMDFRSCSFHVFDRRPWSSRCASIAAGAEGQGARMPC